MAIQYNEKQLKAIYAIEPKVVIVAPPGSGKTRTMCGAIQEYIALHPTHSVTAITFTRKAAAELTEKIHNSKVKTGTIHSWALQQLYAFGTKYDFTVQLLEEEEMRRIMQKIAYSKNLKFVNIFQLYHYIIGNIKTLDLDEGIVKKYEKIKALYIQYKTERGLYDFTDLPQYLLDILTEYNEEIYDIDAFFVDEFQDIDEIQFKIFEKVCANKKFYIGDFRQAIYGFNGSLEDIFERLAASNFKTYHLDTNYRSKQSIMDAADTFRDTYEPDQCVTSLKMLQHSPVICNRGDGGNLYFINKDGICMTNTEEESANKIIKHLINLPNTMILCRSNKQVRKIQALDFENCSTVHQAKGLEYDNIILVDICASNSEELNIAYVGMTRAKNELCVIDFDLLVGILNSVKVDPIEIKVSNILF